MQSTLLVGLPKVGKNVCPICEKAPHDTKTKQKQKTGCLDSIPANLGCSPLVQQPDLPHYTTAAHHLIPVNQCLKPMARLSQMCRATGYDANNKQNGMSLPTVGQGKANRYGPPGSRGVKYGKLAPDDKMLVAFEIMDGTGLQWHVGHHGWQPLQCDTDTLAHGKNYEGLVKIKLQELEKRFKSNGKKLCASDEDDRDQSINGDMNSLSQKIKGRIEGWKQFFVSKLSLEFAQLS